MPDISLIDSNFKLTTELDVSDIRFYNVNQAPFVIYGVFYDSGKFRRIPEDVARSVSEGVYSLHANTAGGRVRFRTDSSYIAIHAKMPSIGKMPHFALTCSAGFDLYVYENMETYKASFIPEFTIEDGFGRVVCFESSQMREITINFPLYSEVSELYIGLREDATVCPPNPYKIEKPIVYYGSSITQGGCASRPGNSYESIISRRFNADYINLGFSGNAKAEPEMTEYINKLDMSVFVYDYDHNSPTVEHLKNTHEEMFLRIRQGHPDIPIVLMSRPKFQLTDEEQMRFEIIQTTYNNAIKNGDKNVYLINGRSLMAMAGHDGTVDNCHPNDLGFASMAKALGDVLQQVFKDKIQGR